MAIWVVSGCAAVLADLESAERFTKQFKIRYQPQGMDIVQANDGGYWLLGSYKQSKPLDDRRVPILFTMRLNANGLEGRGDTIQRVSGW